MARKKPDRKFTSRVRPPLVSAALESALRGTAEGTPLDEPWRKRKAIGNAKGKRTK